MQTKQSIAVIGAGGSMGSALSKSLSKANYRILLSGRDKEKTEKLAEEIRARQGDADIETINVSTDACWEADIIILAVPYSAEKEIAKKIREFANQKVLISISNPVNENFDGLLTAPGTSAAEELQEVLPNVKLVKAFNTSFAANFEEPVVNGIKTDVFIAGDDAEAVETVSELAEAIGFRPLYAGKLKVSETLERMQLLMIQLGIRYKYNWHAGWKILHNQ